MRNQEHINREDLAVVLDVDNVAVDGEDVDEGGSSFEGEDQQQDELAVEI